MERPTKHLARFLTAVAAFQVALQIALLFQPLLVTHAAYAPNEQLGTCFDESWVANVEAALSISASDRKANGQLAHPFLHAALPKPRFTVNDPRTAVARDQLFQADCIPSDAAFYGAGARVDDAGGIIDGGRADGTLIVEINPWSTHYLTSQVFAILVQELLGYEVSFLQMSDQLDVTERMSSVGSGACSPTHVNLEIWMDSLKVSRYAVYANESRAQGSVGYSGRSGLYTTTKLIADGLNTSLFSPTFSADFWRDYRDSESLIEALKVSQLTGNAKHYPPAVSGCTDGVLGCRDSCSKTAACTAREAKGGECLVIVMMLASYDIGHLQAALANNDVPAYFCFLAAGAMNYVIEAIEKDIPVAFYHYEPDEFHNHYADRIERVMLPHATPKRAAQNTHTFGEHGYGGPTDNPVRVDFPSVELDKFMVKLLSASTTSITGTTVVSSVNSLINRFSINDMEVRNLLEDFEVLHEDASSGLSHDEAFFAAACRWLRQPEKFMIWSDWLDPLPACGFGEHYGFKLETCETNTSIFPRRITFHWLMPHPNNASQPYNCDEYGSPYSKKANTMVTSLSCEWLASNVNTWMVWAILGTQPTCDNRFYTYDVAECTKSPATREVRFRWLVPHPGNASLAADCTGGMALPKTVLLDCEYVPYDAPGFIAVVVGAGSLASLLLVGIAFVMYHRDTPVVKRSQHQFLVTMLLGGVFICAGAVMYGGPPTHSVCALRPTLVSWGFTLLFGSLVVKSLRVYRVFLSSSMKRVVLSTSAMFRVLGGLMAVDCMILVVWELVDPAIPTLKYEPTAELGGQDVERLRCASSSPLFLGLLLAWKAIVLALGLYLSVLIRNVHGDFQESVWIFASALAVVFASLLLLPMGYFVDLSAAMFFLFLAFVLLSATTLVLAFMLVPKLLRLHEQSSSSGTTATGTQAKGRHNTGSVSSGDSQLFRSANSGGSRTSRNSVIGTAKSHVARASIKVTTIRKASAKVSAKVSATPVQAFAASDDSTVKSKVSSWSWKR